MIMLNKQRKFAVLQLLVHLGYEFRDIDSRQICIGQFNWHSKIEDCPVNSQTEIEASCPGGFSAARYERCLRTELDKLFYYQKFKISDSFFQFQRHLPTYMRYSDRGFTEFNIFLRFHCNGFPDSSNFLWFVFMCAKCTCFIVITIFNFFPLFH